MCPGYLKTACCNFADIEHFELWPLKGKEKTRHIEEKIQKSQFYTAQRAQKSKHAILVTHAKFYKNKKIIDGVMALGKLVIFGNLRLK